jgi:short-subunit dehydrogenase involved in D-alanine esterification of teichoic acids
MTGGGTGLGKSMSKYFRIRRNVVIASQTPVLEATAKELEELTGGKSFQ